MPIVCDIPLSLEIREVLRREGIKQDAKLRPNIKSLILELLVSVRNEHLLEPAIAYEIYSITEVGHHQLWLEGNMALHGRLLPSVLAEAKELAVVVGTIGPKLEARVADCFDRDEPLRGLLLDGIGSAAVDSLSQEACQFIKREVSSSGYQASSPFSPGMPGFPLLEQWQLFKLLPADKIGVCLTSSAMMVPRKSISMVIGIGPQVPNWTQVEICAHCGLKETCSHRMHT